MDKSLKTPLYLQLYTFLRDDIVAGVIDGGERLPSKRAFAEHLGVSKITVETAYSMLISEGYVYSLSKKGYYAEKNLILHPAVIKASAAAEAESAQTFLMDLSSNTVPPGQFPFMVWAKIMRNICLDYREELLLPVPYNGALCLREAICGYLSGQRGISASPSQIVIGSGSEYLYGIIVRLLGEDKLYAVENPSYGRIKSSYTQNRASCVSIQLDSEGVDIHSLEKVNPDVLHISPSHNFPTGIVTSLRRRRDILSALYADEGRYIIEDDYDSELRFSGKPIPTLYSSDASGRVIYMNTFSKTIAPSVRISYLVLPEKLAERYREIASESGCPVPSFEQYALAGFISDGYFERHLRRNKKYYKALRDKLIAIYNADEISGRSSITESDAGLHFFINLKTEKSDAYIKNALFDRRINCSFYSDYTYEPAESCPHKLLVNYSGLSPESFSVFLTELDKII